MDFEDAIPPALARDVVLGQVRKAIDLLVSGEANGAVAILHSLLGVSADPPEVHAIAHKTLDLRSFFHAFETACRKNGVGDAAYVIFVPIGPGAIRHLVGGTEEAAGWVSEQLRQRRAGRDALIDAFDTLGKGHDELAAELEEPLRAALLAPDPEAKSPAAVEYLVVRVRHADELPLVVAQTMDIAVARAVEKVILEAGTDAMVVRRLVTGGA